MDQRTFRRLCDLVYEKSGIQLGENKVALVCARVAKRMRALGINDHKAYLARVMEDETGEEVVRLLDVISTNVTRFFREPDHFDVLRDCYRNWLAQGQRRFRFWSAACSTGEEPYSMAMVLSEAGTTAGLDLKILATDISTRVLAHCRIGTYSEDKVKDIPADLKRRYLECVRTNGVIDYSVAGALKKLIVFRRLNLSRPPFPMKGPLDAVFCRNVMIYFGNEVKRNLLRDIYRLLKPGGYLMVGHAESLSGMSNGFKMVRPSVYVKE